MGCLVMVGTTVSDKPINEDRQSYRILTSPCLSGPPPDSAFPGHHLPASRPRLGADWKTASTAASTRGEMFASASDTEPGSDEGFC